MTYLLSSVSAVSIVAAVIFAVCLLIGLWKGLLRTALSIVVLGAGIGLTALAAPKLLQLIAEKNYFNQSWLTPFLAEMLVFVLTFAVFVAVLSIIKAVILKLFNKLGALKLTNRLLGAALGGVIGFFIAGIVIYVAVTVIQQVKQLTVEEAVATLDPFAAWMYKADVFSKIVAALSKVTAVN
ncbi:MAG: CvpA family protein [Clostridia bacterium]|nr:CvpA family protein [Clostridia bacterium]